MKYYSRFITVISVLLFIVVIIFLINYVLGSTNQRILNSAGIRKPTPSVNLAFEKVGNTGSKYNYLHTTSLDDKDNIKDHVYIEPLRYYNHSPYARTLSEINLQDKYYEYKTVYYDTVNSIYWEMNKYKPHYYSGDVTNTYELSGEQMVNNQKLSYRFTLSMENPIEDKCALYPFVDSGNVLFLLCEVGSDGSGFTYNLYSFSQEMILNDPYLMGYVQRHTNKYLDYVDTYQFKSNNPNGTFPSGMAQVDEGKYILRYDCNYVVINKLQGEFVFDEPTPYTSDSDTLCGEFLLTPVGNFTIMYGSNQNDIFVFNNLNDSIQKVGSDCTKATPDNNEFYNDNISLSQGAYKSITPTNNDLFEQSYCSGGCCSQEGTIRLFESGDNVYCDIKIDKKLQGC